MMAGAEPERTGPIAVASVELPGPITFEAAWQSVREIVLALHGWDIDHAGGPFVTRIKPFPGRHNRRARMIVAYMPTSPQDTVVGAIFGELPPGLQESVGDRPGVPVFFAHGDGGDGGSGLPLSSYRGNLFPCANAVAA